MDHEQVRDLFTRYHEADLDGKEKEEVETHLDECNECNGQWEVYKKTVGEVSGLLEMKVPPDFSASVAQKIRKRSGGRFYGQRQSFSLYFAIVAFVLILLFMLAYLVLTSVSEITILDFDGGAHDKETIDKLDSRLDLEPSPGYGQKTKK